MKTPIQKLLHHLNSTLKNLLIKEFTKREKEFARKCFIAGADYGLDLFASIEERNSLTQDTFEEYFKQFEDDN